MKLEWKEVATKATSLVIEAQLVFTKAEAAQMKLYGSPDSELGLDDSDADLWAGKRVRLAFDDRSLLLARATAKAKGMMASAKAKAALVMLGARAKADGKPIRGLKRKK